MWCMKIHKVMAASIGAGVHPVGIQHDNAPLAQQGISFFFLLLNFEVHRDDISVGNPVGMVSIWNTNDSRNRILSLSKREGLRGP